jgi:nucleotide-binding universal stress UspA family protein
MFSRILYPTDFSDISKKALDYVIKLKEAGTREVVLVHIIELTDTVRIPMEMSWSKKPASEEQTELDAQLDRSRAKGHIFRRKNRSWKRDSLERDIAA